MDNERVHRKKQLASSIRTIPYKISPLFRFSFSNRLLQYNIAQCCYCIHVERIVGCFEHPKSSRPMDSILSYSLRIDVPFGGSLQMDPYNNNEL